MAGQNDKTPYLGQKDPKTGKVWAGDGWGWQLPATYTRLAGERRLNTQSNPLGWVDNNLAWLLSASNRMNQGTRLVGRAGFVPIFSEPDGQVSTSTPAQRQVAHATTVQPLANAALAATNLGQRLMSGEPLKAARVKAEDTQVGQAIVGLRREAAIGMGAKPIEELTPDQRSLLVELPSSLATNTAIAFVPGLQVGPTAFGGTLSKVPFLSKGAQDVLGRALRWGTNAGINEAVSGIVDDSTQGQAGDLMAAMGAPVPQAFLTSPEDDRISAGVKGILPGIAFGEALGAPAGIASKGLELAPNAMRSLRERRINADVGRVRQEAVMTNLQAEDALGGYEFTRDQAAVAAEPVPGVAPQAEGLDAAPAQVDAVEPVLPQPGELTLDQAPEPTTSALVDQPKEPVVYDPSLPELDAPALALSQLDDNALKGLIEGEGPLLPRLEETLATQPRPEVDPGRSTAWTAAPADSVEAPAIPWREQWEQLPNTELVGAAHPEVSPDLFEKTQGLTGKNWDQFTRSDVIDGLTGLEQDGRVVLPQRLQEGQLMADTQGLAVDPERMQFRDGADPETGVVPGQAIEGKWDPSKEGKIAIWQDPRTGDQVLVDGHRRLDAARRMGIPSLPAEEVIAPNAFAARQRGAARNIAEGTASPLDGGRALRDQGITDLAGMEAAGIPIEGGAGAAAIAGLPDALFRAAEAGEISQGRAMAIGGSGLDEAGMAAAGRFSRSSRSDGLNDLEFAEVMELAGASLRAVAVEGEEVAPKKLGVLDFERMAPLAKVSARVREGLDGRTLELFNQGKADPASPVRQLLDQAAEDIRGGAKSDVVSRRVARQIESAASALPPVERTAEAPAVDAGPVDAPLSASERQGLRAELLARAIENGEVRPSAQPVLPEPDPLSVDVPSALRDLDQQLRETGTIAPDTPAAKLLEDEARLAEAYAERDAIVQNEVARARREAAGFWDLSFDERVKQGLIEDVWTPKPMAETVDTRGQGRFFHGTSQAIPGGKPLSIQGGEYWTDSNIFGNGFYATEDFATAGNQYTQKGKSKALQPAIPVDIYAAADDLARVGGATPQEAWNLTRRTTDIPEPKRLKEISKALRESPFPDYSGRNEMIAARLDELAANPPQAKQFEPAVYEVVEKEPVRFFNGEQPINWTATSPEAKALRSMGGELWDEVKGIWEAEGSMTYAQMVDELRGASRQMGYSRSEATDVIDNLNGELLKLGYGGMTHQGGQRAGGGKRLHEVKIYWEPEKQLSLKRVGAAGPEAEVALNSIWPFNRNKALPELPPGTKLFHGTSQEAARAIAASGLKPSVSGTFNKPGVYFALDKGYADTYAKGADIGQVLEGVLPEGARILDLTKTGMSRDQFLKKYKIGSLINWAKDRGYTGLHYFPDSTAKVDNGKYANGYKGKTSEVFIFDKSGADSVLATPAELSSLSIQGKAPAGQSPLFVELGGDAAAARQIDDMLTDIVRRISGEDAPLSLYNRYDKPTKRMPEWGGGDVEAVSMGSYQPMRDVIAIKGLLEGTKRDLVGTAYHEAFHRVQYGLLTQQEMNVLDSAFSLRKISNYTGLNPKDVASIERMTVAFQNYAQVKDMAGDLAERQVITDVMLAMPDWTPSQASKAAVTVMKAFDKVLELIERLSNYAKGNGFQSIDDIFDRVYSGEIAKSRAFDSALELIEPDRIARAKRLSEWSKDNSLPGKDIDAMLSTLDTQIEALKAKATAGGC